MLEYNSNYVNELLKNNKRLLKICVDLRDVYLTGNWNKKRIRKKIDKTKANELLEGFFKSLGNDVFDLYCGLKKNNICYLAKNTSDCDGACYGMNNDKFSYININNYGNELYGYICIVHEMGHAYHYYLTRNHGNAAFLYIDCEVMSLLFEKLFIKFLEETYDYQLSDNSIWYDYHNTLFWILIETLITSSLIDENRINYINHDLDCKTDYNDFELIAFAENLGYDSNRLPNLSLDGYYYIIGNIISDYFINRMEYDFKNGFKEACNFIQEASYYNIDEILDKYVNDLSYTKDNIRKVIEKGRSYQKRKR